MKIQDIKPFKSLQSVFPWNVYELMADIASCYGGTETLTNVASVSKYNKDAKPMAAYSFGISNYLLEVLSSEERSKARTGIQTGQSIATKLFDYDAIFINDASTNNPLILILPEGTIVTDYSRDWQYINKKPKIEDIPYETRCELFNDVKRLAKGTVLLKLSSLFYNTQTNDFKCLSLEGIGITNGSLSTQEEEMYLDYYERQLFLKRERVERIQVCRSHRSSCDIDRNKSVRPITLFRNEYEFLNNYYDCDIHVGDLTFTNVEAAYQSFKCQTNEEQAEFQCLNPVMAKKKGQEVQLRPDWEEKRFEIMSMLVRVKFEQNPNLRDKLLATGKAELIEGNWWHDNYWGVCSCAKCGSLTAYNHLGKILMELRGRFLCVYGMSCTDAFDHCS